MSDTQPIRNPNVLKQNEPYLAFEDVEILDRYFEEGEFQEKLSTFDYYLIGKDKDSTYVRMIFQQENELEEDLEKKERGYMQAHILAAYHAYKILTPGEKDVAALYFTDELPEEPLFPFDIEESIKEDNYWIPGGNTKSQIERKRKKIIDAVYSSYYINLAQKYIDKQIIIRDDPEYLEKGENEYALLRELLKSTPSDLDTALQSIKSLVSRNSMPKTANTFKTIDSILTSPNARRAIRTQVIVNYYEHNKSSPGCDGGYRIRRNLEGQLVRIGKTDEEEPIKNYTPEFLKLILDHASKPLVDILKIVKIAFPDNTEDITMLEERIAMQNNKEP